ncbi:hypothetical protein FIE12Z_5533 [Fusarium flagelliforme]|uniref:Heterokaryon incompatibility domain-containing protein n=2 Tax=Fusarium flagelliforme TaxID=2675880 RepID=A0A395MST0_9HYPO|nr:hypothetical protein FIE12Z_5533 [Fusarium flagelliforme]
MKTVKNWLSQCDEGHSHGGDGCVTKRRAVNKPTVPTRLIDVHNYDSQTWSLIETRNHHDFSQYVALSHQWTTNTPRLLRSNYLTFQTNQSDMILPRSYQDVFVLCRNLGIQYVWIDSLCIFQDSADDFLHEAATMTEVYANAFCTFSICWESPCGFLRPRDTRVLARWDGGNPEPSALSDRYIFVQDQKELRTAIDQTPVNRRGWVLQEQLLSARVLYLGDDQLYWQCDEATASETAPIKTYTGAGDYERRNLLDHENRNHSAWKNLVVQFMELDLTFERDRLLAISGIARFLLRPLETTLSIDSNPDLYEKKTKKPDQAVEYVAGLNSAHWVEDLLWYPVVKTQTLLLGSGPFDRRPGNIVPSWSWAACPGPIGWSLEHFNPRAARRTKRIPGTEGGSLAYLRSINFEPLGSDAYGLPKSASLEISGLLVQARYTNIGEPSNYNRIVSSTDQTENVNYYATTDGFLLPLPYPRAHSNEASTLDVILEPCVNIVPTCFIVPLVYTRTWNMPRIMGLVVQERPQNDGSVKMREFVRIGSFTKHYGLGADEVIHALVKNLPVGGDEFEQRLRDSARAWKEAENDDGDTEEKGTAKAEWMTIQLV